jgi:hypothetical protein
MKTNILHVLAMKMDTLQIKRKQEKVEKDIAIFCSK